MAPLQPELTDKLATLMVPPAKARHLQQLAVLSEETLAILADKSRKPGIEDRLKKFKNLI
jgi:hypothetical protein